MTEVSDRQESKSTLISRNITVMGRRTSVRLEPEMWSALREISKREKCKTHDICSLIMLRKNPNTSLTAAIRVFLMLYYRAAATNDGHMRAGHGNFDQMIRRARMTEEVLSAGKLPMVPSTRKQVEKVAETVRINVPVSAGTRPMIAKEVNPKPVHSRIKSREYLQKTAIAASRTPVKPASNWH